MFLDLPRLSAVTFRKSLQKVIFPSLSFLHWKKEKTCSWKVFCYFGNILQLVCVFLMHGAAAQPTVPNSRVEPCFWGRDCMRRKS